MKNTYTDNELNNQSVTNNDKNEKLEDIEKMQILRPITIEQLNCMLDLFDEPVKVLQPFDQVTTYFSRVKYATLSVVNPSIKALKREYASKAELSSEELNQIWANHEELDNKNSNRIGLMATLLDPKLKGIETWSSKINEQTISELHEEFQEILRTTTSKEPSFCQLNQHTTSTPDFMKTVFTSNQSHINHEIEINNYLDSRITLI
ncbi:12613_t:CDS:2, partial [Gigaspora margarita]